MKHPLIRRYLTLALLLASIGISYADFDAGVAAYERQDYATALREFRPLAEQGDAEAQNNLGVMYLKGEGVAQDSKAAVQWYSKASEQGHASAQIILGFMYSQGLGVLQDKIRAHMWANLAASNGAGTEAREAEGRRSVRSVDSSFSRKRESRKINGLQVSACAGMMNQPLIRPSLNGLTAVF